MKQNKPPFHFEPSSVFINQPIDPPNWIWENQLAQGCVTFLVGQPKTGKSSFVRSLIKSIATGSPFKGYGTKTCPVAYVALEDHASFLQKSFKQAGIDFDHVHLHYGAVLYDDMNTAIQCLSQACDDYQIKLVIIDPMIRFIRIADTNDYSEVYKKLSVLIEFARKKNIHILLIHHANKGKEENPNQILGSTGIFGSSDGAFFISRKDQIGTIKSNLRYGNSLQSLNFSFNDYGLVRFEGLKAENEVQELGESILKHLDKNAPMSTPDLRQYFKVRLAKLNEALAGLLEDGLIQRTGSGKSNDPYLFSVPNSTTLRAE